MRTLLLVMALAAVCVSPGLASAEIPYAADSRPAPEHYTPAHYSASDIPSLGDLKFGFALPQAADLSAEERYMLAGATKPDGSTLRSWWHDAIMSALAYESSFGTLPTALGLAEINGMTRDSAARTDLLQVLDNPITGAPARFNAVEPDAGCLYLRRLTEAERQHIQQHSDFYRQLWGDGLVYSVTSCKLQPVMFLTEPYYFRMYGVGGRVIRAGIFQAWTEQADAL